MKKITKKVKEEDVIEEVEPKVIEEIFGVESDISLTGEELPRTTASSQSLEYAVSLVSRVFGINSKYYMTSFQDSENKCAITLNSDRYEVTVKVKNKVREGFPQPQIDE